MQAVILFFVRALKFAIGRKTDQGINCPWPKEGTTTSASAEVKNVDRQDWYYIVACQAHPVLVLFLNFFLGNYC